jgi:hypothetical protein
VSRTRENDVFFKKKNFPGGKGPIYYRTKSCRVLIFCIWSYLVQGTKLFQPEVLEFIRSMRTDDGFFAILSASQCEFFLVIF